MIVDLLDILAWPITIMLILFGFRRYVAGVINRMSSFSANASGLKLTFSDQLAQAKSKINTLQRGKTAKSGTTLNTPYQQSRTLGYQFQDKIRDLAKNNGIDAEQQSISQLSNQLKERGILTLEKAEMIQVVNDVFASADEQLTTKQLGEMKELVNLVNV